MQYIVIVGQTNTVYCFCPLYQYNILLLSDLPRMQYIGNNTLQYIVAHPC